MEPRKVVSPLQGRLNTPDPNITAPPEGVFGEPPDLPPEMLTNTRADAIDAIARSSVTDAQISEEIFQEKIRQDIESAKTGKLHATQSTPRDALKELIAVGEYREDVELFKHTWTLKALNQGELILAFNDIKDDNASAVGRISTLVMSQIAYSVEACDGIPIYEWFSEIDPARFASTEEYRLAVKRVFRRYIEQLPSFVITQFDNAYTQIEKKRNEALEKLKNS